MIWCILKHFHCQYTPFNQVSGCLRQQRLSEFSPNNPHLLIISVYVPGNIGVLASNSAKMQPTDHISTAFVYSDAFNMTSGARYHLVTTYLEEGLMGRGRGIKNYSVLNSSSFSYPLHRPKSQIFKSQFLLRRRLEGFRSLWITFAECM